MSNVVGACGSGLEGEAWRAGRVGCGGRPGGFGVALGRAVSGVAVCGLFLTGCSMLGGDDPAQSDQSIRHRQMSGEYILNEDGTLSKIPVHVPVPQLRNDAYEYTASGARFAAEHYLKLVAYAWETGDTQPMKDFDTDECRACQGMATRIEDLYNAGGWEHGTEYRVTEVEASEEVTDVEGVKNTFIVVLRSELKPSDEFKDGKLTHSGLRPERLGFFLFWDGQKWAVNGLSTLELDEGQSANG